MTDSADNDFDRAPETDADADVVEQEGKTRKERVLHTRVPAVLEQELKRLAHSLRVPVSNVVRTILEDAVDAMDAAGRVAEGEIRSVAEKLAEERRKWQAPLRATAQKAAEDAATPFAEDKSLQERPPARNDAAIEGAVGFTPMVLAHDTKCPVTGTMMPAGSSAFLVLFTEPGRHAIVSPDVPPKRV